MLWFVVPLCHAFVFAIFLPQFGRSLFRILIICCQQVVARPVL